MLDVNKMYQKLVMLIFPFRNEVGFHQLEIYRGCAIDLTMRVTKKWNEVWNYEAILGTDPDDEWIGKGNGLANKALATQCAKAWIDDSLRDRHQPALRKGWLRLKNRKSRNYWTIL
jgi:hypothetical protein